MLSLLLSPAVDLMNRMNYFLKFSLINVLFLIPLVALAYMQLQEISQSQNITRTELVGLNSLKQAIALTQTASELRDLTVVQGSNLDLDDSLNQLQIKYIDKLNQLEKDLSPAAYASEKVFQRIATLKKLAAKERGAGTLPERALFSKHNALVLESWLLVHLISFESGLSQDLNSQNFILLKVILNDLEFILEHQGQQRSFSSRVMKESAMTSSMMGSLSQVLDELIDDQKRLANIFRPVLDSKELFGDSVYERASAVLSKLETGTERLENDLMLDENLEHDWQEYFTRESATVDEIYHFIDGALSYVEQHLKQRDNSQNRWFYGLLIIITLVFVITNYLMLAFNVSVRSSIQLMLQAAERVSLGDMTQKIEISNRDELGELAGKFNQMTERMRSLLSQVTTTVESVASQAGVVDGIAQKSSNAVETQRVETDQVAVAINQMVVSVEEVASKTLIASDASSEVDQKAILGQDLVKNTLSDIEQLSRDIDGAMVVIHQLVKDSESISQVLDVIKGVAEQTNLLALNAAIEAARAGDQGRGFAVVADEVRTLAKRTQDSTAEIETMISSLQSGVNCVVSAMEVSHEKVGQTVNNSSEVGKTLEHISTAISRIVELNTQIASAGEQQSMVVKEIGSNIQSISDVGTETAQGAKGTVSACQFMAEQADQLRGMVSSFKV